MSRPLSDSVDDRRAALLRRIRLLLAIFIAGLVVGGATAIPLEWELRVLTRWIGSDTSVGAWIFRVRDALVETNAKHPFIAYGTDWSPLGTSRSRSPSWARCATR